MTSASVIDHLGRERVLLVGHSWGGHLAIRVLGAHPERILGALAVDPIGIVGDCAVPAAGAEISARTPRADRERADWLNQRMDAGKGSEEESQEMGRLLWPAYFADPEHAPPFPETRQSNDATLGLHSELTVGTEKVAEQLAASQVPYTVLAGAASPIPWGQAAQAMVDLSPLGDLIVEPGAGHFV